MEIKKTGGDGHKKMNILVYGPAGVGKTRLCATTGGKTLIISAESGLLSLRDYDIDFVEVKTYDDVRTAFDLASKSDYEWICIDSISEIAEIVLDSEKKLVKDPRQAYGELAIKMTAILKAFRDLPKNVYVSCKQERITDQITGELLYAPSAPGKQVGQNLPFIFDVVAAARVRADKEGVLHYALQTRRCPKYDAKDRSGKLDPYEFPNLKSIFNKVNQPTTKEGE